MERQRTAVATNLAAFQVSIGIRLLGELRICVVSGEALLSLLVAVRGDSRRKQRHGCELDTKQPAHKQRFTTTHQCEVPRTYPYPLCTLDPLPLLDLRTRCQRFEYTINIRFRIYGLDRLD